MDGGSAGDFDGRYFRFGCGCQSLCAGDICRRRRSRLLLGIRESHSIALGLGGAAGEGELRLRGPDLRVIRGDVPDENQKGVSQFFVSGIQSVARGFDGPAATAKSRSAPRLSSFLRAFLDNSASGGLVLMFAAAIALAVANSPLGNSYEHALHTYIGGLSLLHWINDGLMALFFLMVGLEIKREVLDGQLSTWASRTLPGSAAIGGMVGPALIYLAFILARSDTLEAGPSPLPRTSRLPLESSPCLARASRSR